MSNIISQINISKLFQSSYIFKSSPPSDGLYVYLLIIFGIMLLLAVTTLFIYKNTKYKVYKRYKNYLFNLFLTCSLVGLGLIFSRFQQIPYLGSRLMFLLLLLVFIVWGGWIIYFKAFVMSKIIKKEQEKENFSKYLPRRQAGLPDKATKGNK